MSNIVYCQRMRAGMKMGALKSAVLAGIASACIAAAPAIASDYDGSKPLICAALVAISCQANAECKQGTVESLNIPQFFWVDAAAKTVGERDPDGQIRTSSIQSVSQSATYLVLQGSRDSLGWSGTISKASGKLTLTGSNGSSAMVVYGACTPGK
jgi:hypothetical protein